MKFFEPGMVRVKICGITNEADARAAITAGADALGFNFYRGSKRYIDPVEAAEWIRDLGDAVDRVAVVVNPSEQLLDKIRRAGCFEIIQFHGDETPDFCDWAGFARWIKAIRVRNKEAVEKSNAYETPNILLDSWIDGAYGGTGARLDWDMVRRFTVRKPDRRFILAGGLNPQNVKQAIRTVRPHAVDVAGGVEIVPGKKEDYLMKEFVKAVRT